MFTTLQRSKIFYDKPVNNNYNNNYNNNNIYNNKKCWFCDAFCKNFVSICENCKQDKFKKKFN